MPDNKQIVRRLYEDVINHGRLDLLPELIDPAFESPGGGRGPDGFAGTVTGLRAGFPDIAFTVEDLVAEADRVTVRWSWHGTHTGQFRTYAATTRPVKTTGIVIYQLAGGKVTHAWLETDRLGVLQQIGAVP
jgi:predicted ester cyclase